MAILRILRQKDSWMMDGGPSHRIHMNDGERGGGGRLEVGQRSVGAAGMKRKGPQDNKYRKLLESKTGKEKPPSPTNTMVSASLDAVRLSDLRKHHHTSVLS